jgi:hypothetical protein
LRTELNNRLQPVELATILRAIAMLYTDLKLEVDSQMTRFEQHALATCLHIPAGLVAQPDPLNNNPLSSSATNIPTEIDEAEEASVDDKLKQLRTAIASAKLKNRHTTAEIIKLDAQLTALHQTTALADVISNIPGKENLAADATAVAKEGVALQSSITQLDKLKAEKAALDSFNRTLEGGKKSGNKDHDDEGDGIIDGSRERDVLRKVAIARSAPADDLARLRELFTLPG